VTLIATVTVTGAFVPGGSVQFFDGATLLGSSFVGAGSAIFTVSSLTIGAHSITAVYGGDTNGNLASTSPVLIQTVINQTATSTSITSLLNPSASGQSVTFTATVTGASPTGMVQFKDGASNLGSAVTLAGGVATFTTSSLTTGSHSITAVYGGDGNNTTSTSAALTQTVNQAATSTSLVSSLNPSAPGQAVTFTATVTGASPTGTVQFMDSASNLGSAVTLAGGVASFTTSSLTTGGHSITAVYNGDSNNATSTSAVLTQTVNIVPNAPTIGPATAGNAQASVSFTPPSGNGGSAITSYTVTASPGGFTGTGSNSPIIVTGLTNGTAYTFTVTAMNAAGTGTPSAASNSVTPAASQTITFNNPGSQNFGASPTLTATASSGLPVMFTSATTGVCTITSGGVLTTVSAGTCTINANQAGNGSSLAAAQVSQSFAINPLPPTLSSLAPPSGLVAGGTSVTISGTNFTGATAVKFGANAATSFTVNSAGQITVVSPAGAAAGAVSVMVTTPGGTVSGTFV
jgi:hypothetical protein